MIQSGQHILKQVGVELGLKSSQVERTAALLDEGNTIPFIARYRKEMTGGIDEELLRQFESRLAYLRNLAERKEAVLRSIGEQGKLTTDLEAAISEASTLQDVEDLYLPYKPKRRTRASLARERGLEPLAGLILDQPPGDLDLEALAAPFLSEEVPSTAEAWGGAGDIVAEIIAEDADVRRALREVTARTALLVCDLVDEDRDPEGKYRDYYRFEEELHIIPPHRLLAIRRGEKEEVLRSRLLVDEEVTLGMIKDRYPVRPGSHLAGQLEETHRDTYSRLLAPSIEREVFRARGADADTHAIAMFAANLRQLLMQPPLKGHTVIGIDPGYRTGCKVAVVDETGRYLAGDTIYPHPPERKVEQAKSIVHSLANEHGAGIVAIGNGTASRETESFIADMIASGADLAYVIVSEAGASVYSASPQAREELPGLDVSMRGAVSIARRLQDPLAELVKIEPRSIGVGLYQHDVDQKRLSEALHVVVESVVNHVGVDLNTASVALLQYVAGLNKRTAGAIVAHRDAHGSFDSRQELLDVKGLGPKAFTQAAGFLRIDGGKNPLDNTPIHPESYPACRRLLERIGVAEDIPQLTRGIRELVQEMSEKAGLPALAGELEVGEPTLLHILESLTRPGRDPRDDLPAPILRTDVLSIDDLEEGMALTGTVRNIVDFGAFVDIGLKRDGLVHVSQLADRYVRNPLDVVKVGDVVEVKVISIDRERGRIGLSMRR